MHRLQTCMNHVLWNAGTPGPHMSPHPTSSSTSSVPRIQPVLSPAVQQALKDRRPVIALESTIISHGMPYPHNLETALRVEQQARIHGAEPATIAILDGVVHVGLCSSQLEQLSRLGPRCIKTSRRDLAYVVSQRLNGATTVAATMYIASLAGIRLFVTGGIGGVHRGAESSMDISADLLELGRTNVCVVCAGVKSILDIGRTLEVLETQGVTVAAYGTAEFPAFFTAHSGHEAPMRLDTPLSCAQLIQASQALGLTSGSLIGVPIPSEHSAQAQHVESAIQQALRESDTQQIRGRDITPFLLKRVNELTGGASLAANIALILNNVKVGALIAVELAKLQQQTSSTSLSSPSSLYPSCIPSAPTATHAAAAPTAPAAISAPAAGPAQYVAVPVVIGGTNHDLLGRPSPGSKFLLGTSNQGTIAHSWGGVGRNVAEVLARLGCTPYLISCVGRDADGEDMLHFSSSIGMRTELILRSAMHPTCTYMAVLDERGDLFTTIADMRATDELSPSHIPPALLAASPLVVLDGNVSAICAAHTAAICAQYQVPLCYEPTSIEKSLRIIEPLLHGQVTYLTPSAAELLALCEAMGYKGAQLQQGRKDAYEYNHATADVEQQCVFILQAIAQHHQEHGLHAGKHVHVQPTHIILKRGKLGVLLASLLPLSVALLLPSQALPYVAVGAGDEYFHAPLLLHVPARALRDEEIKNTSGAGDSLVGVMLWWLLQRQAQKGEDMAELQRAVQYGMRGAEATLRSEYSVAREITPAHIEELQRNWDAVGQLQGAAKL